MTALALVPATVTVWILLGVGSWIGLSLLLGLAWVGLVSFFHWRYRRRVRRRCGDVAGRFSRGCP